MDLQVNSVTQLKRSNSSTSQTSRNRGGGAHSIPQCSSSIRDSITFCQSHITSEKPGRRAGVSMWVNHMDPVTSLGSLHQSAHRRPAHHSVSPMACTWVGRANLWVASLTDLSEQASCSPDDRVGALPVMPDLCSSPLALGES